MTEPSWIVLHTMVGSESAASARFQQPSEQASATYGVRLDGTVLQWVDEKDAAWANGATGQGGKGDNLDSISIEHEDGGDFNGPRTPQLYATSAALVRDICTRYQIPIDRQHIIGHRECDFASTACPDALDLDRIVAMARGGSAVALMDDPAFVILLQKVEDIHGSIAPDMAALQAKLSALLSAQGVEKVAIDALAANAAAATALTALSVKLDVVLSGIPAGSSPGVLADVDAVKAELVNLGKHLGVDVTTAQ
jgi:hypothetical protein